MTAPRSLQNAKCELQIGVPIIRRFTAAAANLQFAIVISALIRGRRAALSFR
jgi:hypothetical protein